MAGGSTITQQVARNLLLTNELGTRSIRRKVREIFLAWELTEKLSKDEILEIYLNQTYYGGMAYGVEAASRTFFGKSPSDLTLSECALLTGLPQSPGVYNPFINPVKARERQLVVLGLMEKDGFITSEERRQAEEITLHYLETPYPIEAPHFIWMIRNQVDTLYANGILDLSQSLVIRTTLDLNIQEIAEEAITRQLAEFQSRMPEQNIKNAALVAIEPLTGEILALVGSADYFNGTIDGAVNMALADRQPGSAFKPFLYAQALDPDGPFAWTAATSIMDVSTTFLTHEGTSYTPRNYDGLEHGPISVREALASSLNIPAVITLQQVGIENTIHFAGQLGITSLGDPNEYDLSLALGGGQMSLLKLTAAYAVLANNGIGTDHPAILDIRSADGDLLYQWNKTSSSQIIDSRVAWLLSDILSDDEARRLGFGVNSTLKIDRPAAVKTGTTTNYHDNWTIGYTPDMVIGVWVGNSDYQAMKDVTGLTGAAPIWHETIRKVLEGKPKLSFVQPGGLVSHEVCAISGLLPTEFCDHTRTEWFIEGTEPVQYDTVYRQIFIDKRTGKLSNQTTLPSYLESRIVLDLPVAAQPWARAQGLPLLVDIQQDVADGVQTGIAIISPRSQAIFRIDPGFDSAAQKILIEAVVGIGIKEVTIWVDGNPLVILNKPPFQTWWQLSPGGHQIWATGSTGDGGLITSETITFTAEQ
jgi:penicillin-binding protein 1C